MKSIYKKVFFLLVMLPLSLFSQTTVTGTVVDSKTNQPIPGVNINVQGSSTGTSTDFDGKFKLNKIKSGDKLIASFVGYKNLIIEYNGQQTIIFNLLEEANKLQEVVVQVGYGSVKKKDATGSVEVLTAKDFNKGANFNVEGLISGRIAGVVVTAGGRPGDGAAIRIRGGSSLDASNDPLIVLDGLPLDGGAKGSNNILSSLNPNDIDTFSILKDASATAIYGSRGSNGVILITTKKGAKGGLKGSISTTFTYNTLAKKQSTLSGDEFRAFVNNPANALAYGITPARIARLGTANTDWQSEIYQNSVSIDNNINLRGELFKFLPTNFSFGHTYAPGLLKTSNFDRTVAALRMNPSFFNNHLKVNLNINYSLEKNRIANEGAIGSAISFDPTQPVYDPRSPLGGYFEWYNVVGSTVDYSNTGLNNLATSNPVSLLNERFDIKRNNRYFGNVQVEYIFHFLPELKAVGNYGIDDQYATGSSEITKNGRGGYITAARNFGSQSSYYENKKNRLLDGYLNYNKKFNKLNVDLTAGYSYQNFQTTGNDSGNIFDPTNTIANRDYVYINPQINLQSAFTRATLGFDDKYLLTVNYRRDGSSRFSTQNRYGNFPGGAFAWVASKESFLKDSKSLTNLKFRFGWGVTGQQDIAAAYAYIPSVSLGVPVAQYQFGNNFITPVRVQGYNEGIKWEETTTKNFGVDFELFKKVTATIDVYQKDTKDLLAYVAYPDGSNLSNFGPRNFGNLVSKGAEISLGFDAVKNQNVTWRLNFNAAYQDRKITALAGDTNAGFPGYLTGGIQGGSANTIQINTTDYAPNSFYVFEQVYGADGKPIEGAYVDRNGDGVVDGNDRYRYKKPYADFTFGLLSNLSYKNWDMSMSWRASLGNYMYDNNASLRGYGDQSFNQITPLNNVNPSTIETGFKNEGNNRYFSDYYVRDASFIKLDNVSIGYNLQKPFGANTTARFNLGVQNALIISKYKGLDPEVFNGIDQIIYPRARMFVFGCNVNF